MFRVRELVPSLPLNGIIQWLGDRGGTIGNANGPLSDTMGPHLVTALLALRPELATTIGELTTPRGQPLSGEEGERLALEKDATGVILDSALDEARDMLLDWEPVQSGEPFLRGVRDNRTAHEHHLIGYDAGRFEDWVPVNTREADWKTFAKGGQAVRILNANNGPVETDLGIDLVYFNMSLRSFVLVQYKKMKPDAEGKLWYRGDRRLESQLARMLKVDTRCGGAGGDFRLYPMPCFLKLCEPYALVPDSKSLIPGLYLAREHFEQLWNDPKLTERSRGRRLGWTNVERHLTNTQFTGLVKGGWIGSRGTATSELIRSIIGDSLGSGRPVVAGIKLPRTSDDQDATRS